MLLIVTNKRDLACDFLILRLKERRIAFIRLNTEDYGIRYEFDLSISQDGARLTITFDDGKQITNSSIYAVYLRQPLLPTIDREVASEDRDFAAREIREHFRSLWRVIEEKKWVNHPRHLWLASNKIEQLSLAVRTGFTIPDTLVTRSLPRIQEFSDQHRGQVICKAVKNGFVNHDDGATVALTQRIDKRFFAHAQEYASIPSIYQNEIRKTYDIRVIVVGASVFATAIHSQEHSETEVDWRAWDVCNFSLRHERIDLPTTIGAACQSITAHYQLAYSAIDLILGEDGTYYFLEMNPNGQWAWIEHKTGYPIRDALIDCMGYQDVNLDN